MWNRIYNSIRLAIPVFLLCIALFSFNVNSTNASNFFTNKISTVEGVNNFVASIYDTILNLFVKKTKEVYVPVPVYISDTITTPVSEVVVDDATKIYNNNLLSSVTQKESVNNNILYIPGAEDSESNNGKEYVEMEFFQNQVETIYNSIYNSTIANIDSHTETEIHGGGSSGISFATVDLGGTGISTVPNYGELLMGDGLGGYSLVATSSLGLLGGGGSSQWTTSGSDIYYTTGSVGIGTTTPQYGLHIFKSVGSASQNIQTADAAGEAAINLENSVRRWKIKATTASGDAFVIRDQTAGQDRFVIGNTGNIGIGSTSPYAKLSVSGTSIASTTLALRPISGQTANILDVYNTSGVLNTVITAAGNVGIGTASPDALLGFANALGDKINFYKGSDYGIGVQANTFQIYSPGGSGNRTSIGYGNSASFTSVLNVTGGGSVGIGTTTPGANLDVNGTTRLGGPNVGVYPALVLNNKNADASGVGAGLQFKNRNDASNYMGGIQTIYRGGITSALTMMDFFAGGDSVTPKMTLSGGGNLGIGTTSPLAKLNVYSGGSGVGTANTAGDDLVVENSNDGGISILTPNANSSFLMFGSPADNFGAGAYWNSNNDLFTILTANTGADISFQTGDQLEAMRIFDSGNIAIGTSTPASGSAVRLTSVSSQGGGIQLADTDGGGAVLTGLGGDAVLYTYTGLVGSEVYSERLRVLGTSGFVGIGTTTPSVKLETYTTGTFSLAASSNNGSLWFGHDATTNFIQSVATNRTSAQNLYIGGYATQAPALTEIEGASIFLNGNVGIGTSTPQRALSIYKSSSPVLQLTDSTAGESVNDGFLLTQSGLSTYLENTEAGPMYFRTSAANRMVIGANGNVGVGTSSPLAKLDIYDASASSAIVLSSGYNTGADSNKNWGLFQSGFNYGDFAIKESNVVGGNPISAGTTRLLIQKVTGNVGIGTTSPASLLHLSGNGGVPQLIISGTAAGQNMKDWRFVADSTSLFLGTLNESTTATGDYAIRLGRETNSNDVDYIEFATNNEANKMRLTNSGNLGIGTTSPNAKLSVYGGSAGVAPPLTTGIVIEHSNDTGLSILTPDSSQSFVTFGNTSDSNAVQLVWDPVTDLFDIGLANAGADLRFMTGDNTEAVRILDTGNVGIGTTTPNAKLSVYSGAAGAYTVNAAADELVLENSSSGGMTIATPDASTGNIFFSSPSRQIGSQLSWNYSNLLMTLGTGVTGGQVQFLAGNATEAMRINASGNVGIGTTSPYKKLSISDASPAIVLSSTNTNISAGATYGDIDFTSNDLSGAGLMARIRAKANDNNFGGDADITFWTRAGGAEMLEKMRLTSFGGLSVGSTTGAAMLTVENITSRNSFVVSDQALDPTPFVIDNSGNVGIGTASPLEILDLSGGYLNISAGAGACNNCVQPSGIKLASDASTNANTPIISNVRGATSADQGIDFRTYFSGSVSAMRILGNGNVGVGNTAPSKKLDVNGSIRFSGQLTDSLAHDSFFDSFPHGVILSTPSGSYASAVGISIPAGTDSTSRGMTVYDRRTTDHQASIQVLNPGGSDVFGMMFNGAGSQAVYKTGTADQNFVIGSNFTTNSVLYLKSGGNVGIATTSPTALLSLGNGSGPAGTTPALGINFGDPSANLYRLTTGMIRTDGALAVQGNLNMYYGNQLIMNKAGNNWLNFAARDITGPEAVYNLANIGTITASGTVTLNGLTSSATGNALCITSAKELTDSGGSSCTPSSIRFKENVTTLNPGYAMDTLSKLKVVHFDYKEKQPYETNHSYGLIAEEVANIDNNLVDYGYDGLPVSLHFEKITGLLVQAVQEQKAQIEEIKSQAFLDKIIKGVTDSFASVVVRMQTAFVGELHVQEKLCVDDVCINKDQLKIILMNSGGTRYIPDTNPQPIITNNNNTNTDATSSTTEETTPPQASTTPQVQTPIEQPNTEPTNTPEQTPTAPPVEPVVEVTPPQASTTPQVQTPIDQPSTETTNTPEQTPTTPPVEPVVEVTPPNPEPVTPPVVEPAPAPEPAPISSPEPAPTEGQ